MAAARLLIKAAMRSADVGHLADQIQRLEQGGIDALHFDVMDGRFVPEICMGPSFIHGLRKCTTLPFEVHLLVQESDGCLGHYLEAGADTILIHIETSREPAAMLQRVRALKRQVGLALAPATPASAVTPYLELCDMVNVMTVAPGQPGTLQEGGVENLRALSAAAKRLRLPPLVQADGAVSAATWSRLIEAGAGALIAGFPVFSRDDYGAAILDLRDGASAAASAPTSGAVMR